MFVVMNVFHKTVKEFSNRCAWIREQPSEHRDRINAKNDEVRAANPSIKVITKENGKIQFQRMQK